MKVKFLVVLIVAWSFNLYAVPGFIVHQGYMEDSNGNPVSGTYSLVIGIYESPDKDDILFEQELSVSVIDGFYTVEIDDSAIIPLFDVDKDLYLEISVDGKRGSPRQKIGAVPYAFYAMKAYDVIGDIHPKSIYINGNQVIDETGKYTGPIAAVTSITAGDGLNGGTITSTGTISLKDEYLDGSAFDSRFINNNEPDSIYTDMVRDSAITGQKIAPASISLNHLSNSGCSSGQIMKYNGSTWECNQDLNSTYTNGAGLNLDGNTFSVNFAGSGTATTVARSDHNHDAVYASILHHHDERYAPIGHNHDPVYVNTSGDTMTGGLDIHIDPSGVNDPVALTTSNGSILFEGPEGVTPAKGEGIRFMWIPSRSALRAGYAFSDEWDDYNIGKGSIALGTSVVASGDESISMGTSIAVSGSNGIAIGRHISSKGVGSITIGSGDDFSPIGGPLINNSDNTIALGTNSQSPTLVITPGSGGTTTGMVGIGVTSPVTKLDVDGGIKTKVEAIMPERVISYTPTAYLLQEPDIKCSSNNVGEMRIFTLPNPGGGAAEKTDMLCACMRDPDGTPMWHCYK